MGQQLLDPLGPQARDVAEAGALHAFAPLLAVEADRKTVGLIAQAPQQHDPQLAGLALDGLLGAGQEHLLPLLGQGANHQLVVQVQFPQGLHHGGKLALATVDHHHIGPVVEAARMQGRVGLAAQLRQVGPLGLGLGPAAEAAPHDFGHGHEVVGVAGADAAALDPVLAVVLLGWQAIDEHHLGGHRIAALDVADVEAFDAPRRGGEIEQLGQVFGG